MQESISFDIPSNIYDYALVAQTLVKKKKVTQY